MRLKLTISNSNSAQCRLRSAIVFFLSPISGKGRQIEASSLPARSRESGNPCLEAQRYVALDPCLRGDERKEKSLILIATGSDERGKKALAVNVTGFSVLADAPENVRQVRKVRISRPESAFPAACAPKEARALHRLSAVIQGSPARHAQKREFIEVRERPARRRGKLCRAPFAARAGLAGFGAWVMSLSVALNTAVSGLFANQTAIAATSENIANVNTPNFSRREARFQTDAIPNQFAGVDVEIVRAAADRFLQAASFGASATAARTSAIADALAAIEASLGAPGDNISFANRLDDAFAALTALSANPSSTVAKADALAALQEAFGAFARTSEAVTAGEGAAAGRLSADASRANALLEEIFRLNQAVSQSPGAADLIDQRLTELSTLLPIAVERGEDGRVSVSLPSGALLVNSAGFNALSVSGGPPATVTIAGADATAGLNGGAIGGYVALINVELPRLAALIETTARGVADRLNAVYAANVGVGATAPSAALLIVETAGVFSVNAALLADPASFAIARPPAGSLGGLNDGAGAILLADIAATAEARAAGAAVAEIGARALSAERAAETDNLLSSELSARAASSAGVNLDEELSNLILYQRAYSANARVIAAVDELWQSLLQIV